MKTAIPNIEEFEIFEDLSLRKKARLKQIAMLQQLKRGEFVYLPGDESSFVYLLASGRVKIAKISENGKELTLSFHNPGELFGELALLNDEPRRTMAVLTEASRIWVLPKVEFLEIVSTSPKFSLALSTIIGQRRHDLENRMESLVFKDVPARLAGQILRLADQYGKRYENEIVINIKLSQLELANLIGATRETTSTAINDMKRAGILDTSHRTIIIRDIEALQDIKESL